MTTYDYRVLAKEDDIHIEYGIYLVRYDAKGTILDHGSYPITPYGDNFKELVQDIAGIRKALRSPILSFNEFPKVFDQIDENIKSIDKEKKYLTPKEAAVILGISYESVRTRIKHRNIKIKKARPIKILKRDLNKLK